MIDDNGVIAARSKEVKLRLLNEPKAEEEETKWRLINIILPLILLRIFPGNRVEPIRACIIARFIVLEDQPLELASG